MQLQLVDIDKIYAALDSLEDVEKDKVVRLESARVLQSLKELVI